MNNLRWVPLWWTHQSISIPRDPTDNQWEILVHPTLHLPITILHTQASISASKHPSHLDYTPTTLWDNHPPITSQCILLYIPPITIPTRSSITSLLQVTAQGDPLIPTLLSTLLPIHRNPFIIHQTHLITIWQAAPPPVIGVAEIETINDHLVLLQILWDRGISYIINLQPRLQQ